jgi:hypothetical protein
MNIATSLLFYLHTTLYIVIAFIYVIIILFQYVLGLLQVEVVQHLMFNLRHSTA